MILNLKNRPLFSFAFTISLALHVVIFTCIYNRTHDKQTPTRHDLSLNSQGTHIINLNKVKLINKKQIQEIKNRQIVANELSGKKIPPKQSRFAGEADQSFERQTMAAINGAFKKAGLGSKAVNQVRNIDSIVAKATPAQTEKKNKIKSNDLSLSSLGSFAIPKVEDVKKNPTAEIEKKNRTLEGKTEKASVLGIANGSSDSSGLASNNDFVEEVPLGDMTHLNTTEFKYYGFYHRIRQKLEQYWGSSIQSKAKNLYRSGRRIPASDNLITAISVTIDDHGNILNIKIDGTSGIRELDQAAVESFNKAGPFPNPPKGLLVDGRATIQWGFVIKS